jgi:hypothetical protein
MMVSNVRALIDLYDHTGPPVTYGDHFLMAEMNAAINQSRGGIDRYAYVSDLMANPRTADEALNYINTAVDDLCTIQEAEGTAPAKQDTPVAESDNADLKERHINIIDISTNSKVNRQPTMRTILRGIRNGDPTLHYARWEHFNDRNGDGSREGPLLEIAYWIRSKIRTLGPMPTSIRKYTTTNGLFSISTTTMYVPFSPFSDGPRESAALSVRRRLTHS